MKHFYILIIILESVSFSMLAQQKNEIQRPSLGLHLVLYDFTSTDINKNKFGLSLNYLHGLTPRVDLQGVISGSFLSSGSIDPDRSKKSLFLETDATVRVKLLPGQHSVNPFAATGFGLSHVSGNYDMYIPAGLGVQMQLPGETFLLLNGQYRAVVTNDVPDHFYCSIGIAGVIGKKKRISKKSKPGTALFVPQTSDRDSDGDGIADKDDACPTQPGALAFNGCPDTDGDGIPDKDDKCPLIKGTAFRQGCPPPDRDHDGVADSLDRCPDLPGFQSNAGCPIIPSDLTAKIDLAAKNIFFETDKFILLPASYPALDTVISILKTNPYLNLAISGHTDSTGTPEKNKTLSANRAAAVLHYLQEKGSLPASRISSAGYGSDHPVAPNTTADGRALNRRVEMKLRYY